MEKILQLQNKHWGKKPYKGLFTRSVFTSLLPKLKLKSIEVVLGVRRSGKSTIFRLIINELIKKYDPCSILYINLDDPFFAAIWHDAKTLYSVVENAEKMTGKKIHYLFLDEVQNVVGWEKFVKSVYDAEMFKKIFVTGSNSTLLEGDYATLLSGRYLIDMVYPLTLAEYLTILNIKQSKLELLARKTEVLNCVDNLLRFGAFPEILLIKKAELKRELLIGYYNTILLKDCLAKSEIRDSVAFRELARYLIANITHIYSYKSLARVIEESDKTAKQFIQALASGYLIREISAFSYSVKKQMHGRKKSYAIDNGLVNSVAFLFSGNSGQLFENLVLTELLKYGIENIGFYREKYECDFIVKQANNFYGIQACYELNEHNRAKEINGLMAAIETYKLQRGYIITYDQEEAINSKVYVMPFWKVNWHKLEPL